ncbi:MAG: CrcB family protein [Pseudomonadota bacterium]
MSDFATTLIAAVGGGLGALCRYVLSHMGRRAPLLATLGVNALGCLILGGLLASTGSVPAGTLILGFTGGFTTFSTFALQTRALGPLPGALNVLASFALCLCALALGGWVVGSFGGSAAPPG